MVLFCQTCQRCQSHPRPLDCAGSAQEKYCPLHSSTITLFNTSSVNFALQYTLYSRLFISSKLPLLPNESRMVRLLTGASLSRSTVPWRCDCAFNVDHIRCQEIMPGNSELLADPEFASIGAEATNVPTFWQLCHLMDRACSASNSRMKKARHVHCGLAAYILLWLCHRDGHCPRTSIFSI